MENQPKLNSSKEVIAFLAERFPLCFTTEGETRPLKIGIFQDLVERVPESDNVSKTQLRSALRLYTSSWRYLYGVKLGAQRVDLDGNPCGELEQQHVDHARTQLEEAKARVQAQRAEQQAKNVKQPESRPTQRVPSSCSETCAASRWFKQSISKQLVSKPCIAQTSSAFFRSIAVLSSAISQCSTASGKTCQQ